VYYAMARDGVLPRALGHAITRSETPARAIALQSVWVSVLIVCFGAFEPVVVYTGTVVAIFSAIAVAAVIVLRVRRPRLLRPFRTPGYPWLPAAYIAVCVWIFVYTAHARPMETALGLATAAAGLPIYWLHQERSTRRARRVVRGRLLQPPSGSSVRAGFRPRLRELAAAARGAHIQSIGSLWAAISLRGSSRSTSSPRCAWRSEGCVPRRAAGCSKPSRQSRGHLLGRGSPRIAKARIEFGRDASVEELNR